MAMLYIHDYYYHNDAIDQLRIYSALALDVAAVMRLIYIPWSARAR